MSRHCAYTVVLEKDLKDEDADVTLQAIRMIRGVQGVTPVEADPHVHVAESRARRRLLMEVWELVKGTKDYGGG